MENNYDDSYHCFRCKGLAVIDRSVLRDLPALLYRAYDFIDKQDDPREFAYILMHELQDMAVLLESIPDD